jgi:hypothetical protein
LNECFLIAHQIYEFSKSWRTETDYSWSFSAKLPLHDSLIVTTNGEEPVGEVTSTELDAHDVLRVASERSRLDSLSGRVTENVDKTEVITSTDE